MYCARHAPHIGKPAIVVCARSYGSPVTTVKRGPQLVQTMNGWRYLRSAGSASSARHSAQVAMSGETRVRVAPPSWDAVIANPGRPVTATAHCSTDSTAASGGASSATRAQNAATSAAGPSTSATTPSPVFVTWPDSPSRPASA